MPGRRKGTRGKDKAIATAGTQAGSDTTLSHFL